PPAWRHQGGLIQRPACEFSFSLLPFCRGMPVDWIQMQGPTYPAARIAASRIHARLAAHAEDARLHGQSPIATLPAADVIEAIVSAAFWASLRREEGYSPKISLAFLSPQESARPML